ncbi:MAG: hypothetical protein AAB958_02660 [Patescibacteria group bacterium]
MKIKYYPGFKDSLRHFPKEIREKFYKQANYLLRNIRYPSLRAKKYDESRGIWQARIDKNIRFYFLIKDDTYILLDIRKHLK